MITMGLMLMMFFLATFIYESTRELQAQIDVIKRLMDIQTQVIARLLKVVNQW